VKKLAKFALGVVAAIVSSQVCATSILHVWEDDNKSKGITQAVIDFENNMTAKLSFMKFHLFHRLIN